MKKYSQEVRDFITENVAGRKTKELVQLVNDKFGLDFTESKMQSYKKNWNLKSETPKHKTEGSPTKLFPAEIKTFISENYIGCGHQAMANILNDTFDTNYTGDQIKAYYGRNKLDSKLNGQFEKGQIPWNKGKPKTWKGGESTQFKIGHVPKNYRSVGSERINVDGYTEIKIADPNKWRLKHQVVWEKNNGPIPKGHVVIFGDSNRQNFDLNNLILVTKRQLLELNQNRLIQNDANLTKTAVLIADVNIKIKERKKRG